MGKKQIFITVFKVHTSKEWKQGVHDVLVQCIQVVPVTRYTRKGIELSIIIQSISLCSVKFQKMLCSQQQRIKMFANGKRTAFNKASIMYNLCTTVTTQDGRKNQRSLKKISIKNHKQWRCNLLSNMKV